MAPLLHRAAIRKKKKKKNKPQHENIMVCPITTTIISWGDPNYRTDLGR